MSWRKIIMCLCFCMGFSLESLAGTPLKVSLLLEHDQPSSWNELLKSGLSRAINDFGVDASIVVAPKDSSQVEIFRNAASKSDLLIVASDSLHEILRDNAGNYRKVMFACIDAGIRAPNIMCITFADEQAAFLAGAFAALLSREGRVPGIKSRNIIGWLSGEDTPAMRTLFNGYAEGASLAVPGIRVAQAITGSFADSANVAQKTAYLLDSGADIIALAAGAGNYEAAEIISERGAWYIELDEWKAAPKALGAITKDVAKAIHDLIGAAATGNFHGKEITAYNIEDKGTDFTISKDFLNNNRGNLSENFGRRYKEIQREMQRGAIKTRSLRARTLCDCLD